MKTTRYRFEQLVQEVKEDTTEWLIEELRAILTSDKDFTRKCDYIGFSITHLDAKVASIDEEIKELQQLKKNLKAAKDITLTIGAEVFSEYGIDKLEGAGISSITVTEPTTKTIKELEVIDEEALITAGYCRQVLDEEAVIATLNDNKESLGSYAKLNITEVTTQPKLKINKRRASNSKSVPVSLKEISNEVSEMEKAS